MYRSDPFTHGLVVHILIIVVDVCTWRKSMVRKSVGQMLDYTNPHIMVQFRSLNAKQGNFTEFVLKYVDT